jgi:AcrR family transcriptional regulator
VNHAHPTASQAPQLGLPYKQGRSKHTYDAMVSAGFKLLEERDFQDISIADLTQEAGYSVGAFYARFRSKDEFFDVLVAQHLDNRTATQIALFATLPRAELLSKLVEDIVGYYWQYRKFWRAVLLRSVRDPEFYNPMRQHRQDTTQRFIQHLAQETGRELYSGECGNIAFAFMVVYGTLDSIVINEPGELPMDQAQFTANLTRTFALVSGAGTLLIRPSEQPPGN